MPTTHLRITAKQDGFRRAGIRHPAEPVDHELKNLTKAQIEALKAEPALKVEEIDAKAEQKSAKKNGE